MKSFTTRSSIVLLAVLVNNNNPPCFGGVNAFTTIPNHYNTHQHQHQHQQQYRYQHKYQPHTTVQTIPTHLFSSYFDEEEESERDFARVRRRGRGRRSNDDDDEDDGRWSKDELMDVANEVSERGAQYYEDDDDYDDDDDYRRKNNNNNNNNDGDDNGMNRKGIIPNALLDQMDPDGAVERFPELIQDKQFWIDTGLFLLFINFMFCIRTGMFMDIMMQSGM